MINCRVEPSKEMRGAMKVMSDSLKRSPRSEVPAQLKNAVGIIQQEWFKVEFQNSNYFLLIFNIFFGK